MYQQGHYGAALLVYAPVAIVASMVVSLGLVLIGGVVVVWLSMLPDLDQRVPLIEHRGVTHTVWFALLVGGVIGAGAGLLGANTGFASVRELTVFGFVVGTTTIVSHILADALTPMGVRPFAPLDRRHVSYNVTRAKNPLANYTLLLIGVLVAGATMWFIVDVPV